MDVPVPEVVIRRLPIYARTLQHLAGEGQEHVSSEELGERIDVSAAQIRRDLAYFGDFGKQIFRARFRLLRIDNNNTRLADDNRAVAASAAKTYPDIRLQHFHRELWRRLLCPRGHGENSAYKQGNC